MKKYALIGFTLAAGGWFAHDVYAHQQAQAAKWASFQKFPYLSVEDDWCTSRRVHPRHCLTPGNLSKLVLQGR